MDNSRCQNNSDLLIIFAKNPIVGKVKSRLSSAIGHKNAYQIYLDLLKRTRNAVLNLPCCKVVFYSEHIDSTDSWNNSEFLKQKQSGTSLGDRMQNAIKWGFDKKFEKVILIGTDIYYLNQEIIQNGFSRLEKHDVILGPTYDGGYYLIGQKELHSKAFDNVSWSTNVVFNQTMNACNAESLSVHSLPILADIDCVSDLNHLKPEDRASYESLIKTGATTEIITIK